MKSKVFYDSILTELEHEPAVIDPKWRCIYYTTTSVVFVQKTYRRWACLQWNRKHHWFCGIKKYVGRQVAFSWTGQRLSHGIFNYQNHQLIADNWRQKKRDKLKILKPTTLMRRVFNCSIFYLLDIARWTTAPNDAPIIHANPPPPPKLAKALFSESISNSWGSLWRLVSVGLLPETLYMNSGKIHFGPTAVVKAPTNHVCFRLRRGSRCT